MHKDYSIKYIIMKTISLANEQRRVVYRYRQRTTSSSEDFKPENRYLLINVYSYRIKIVLSEFMDGVVL